MGYDQQERSSSSGAVVVVLVIVLLLAVLGGLFLVGVGAFFWVSTARVQQQAVVDLRRAEAERARAVAEAAAERMHADAMAQIPRASAETAASNSEPDLTVRLDKDGKLHAQDEQIDLDELKTRLRKLQDESGEPVSLHITVHPDSLHAHLVPVLEAFEELAVEVSFRIASPDETSGEDQGS